MARKENPLHDHPRSKNRDERREASTYKGGEVPDKAEIDPGEGPISSRRDRPISDDLEFGTEHAEPDHTRRPGEKGYLKTKPMAKKGDVKEIDGEEYESVGGEMSDDERRNPDNRATGTPDKPEYWKKRKREVPTS
jgi:hypothetical protein